MLSSPSKCVKTCSALARRNLGLVTIIQWKSHSESQGVAQGHETPISNSQDNLLSWRLALYWNMTWIPWPLDYVSPCKCGTPAAIFPLLDLQINLPLTKSTVYNITNVHPLHGKKGFDDKLGVPASSCLKLQEAARMLASNWLLRKA